MNEQVATVVPRAFPDVVPLLTKGAVRLRAMTERDLPSLVEQSNDPESIAWTVVPQPYGLDDARAALAFHAEQWTESGGRRYWAIERLPLEDAPGTPFAGVINVRPSGREGDAWETGFSLHPAARGRGLMSAALRLAAQWAFDQGAPSLRWWAARGNFASWRVAHTAGFTHHGTLPSAVQARASGSADAWVASLLPGQSMTPRHPWVVPPVIEADGLRLRPIRDEDRAVAEPHDHPAHHLPARAVPTPETFDDWLLRRREGMSLGRGCTWCIADAATDDPLGEVLLFVREGALEAGGSAELGYSMRPSARGRGIAGRAARLASAHALRPVTEGGLGLRRLLAETAADNAASNRVLAGAGFTVWGREEAADAPDGSIGPALHWERLA